ncbi:hypothetical protein HPG69_016070 [Diceros bicornis minor]|uniref:Uncharacterized protein n=1 Tax=Diceros bicornis minor TaxID=77932 RepID=A0A7J7FE82_DICBM|nr:hypothetical protein HPG69_016070 [Diceros bicornis minor]
MWLKRQLILQCPRLSI